MDRLASSTQNNKTLRFALRYCGLVLFPLLLSPAVIAFELLSEGAMDSVSAVSAESAEEIINVAGSPAAGLTVDGYEQLPFQTRIEVDVEATDQVSEELDFSLVQEVEAWADELRDRQGSGFEVGYVEELPESTFSPSIDFEDYGEDVDVSGSPDEERIRYEVSRVNQTFELLESGPNIISYRFERYIERTATVDADPFDETRILGDGYITDIRSGGEVTLTDIKDEFKPLF